MKININDSSSHILLFFSKEWKTGFPIPQPYFSFKAWSSSNEDSLRASIFWNITPSTVGKVEGFGVCQTRGKNKNTDSRLSAGEQTGQKSAGSAETYLPLSVWGTEDCSMWRETEATSDVKATLERGGERIKRLKKKKRALRKTTSLLCK